MSDFSLFSLFTAGLACIAPLAAAYTQPVGPEPIGNTIYQPGLKSIVPAGEGFSITWKPTTEGPVTLVLLKGPATDLKLVNVIVEGTANDGEYVWTPSTDLEPTADDTGYGIQLIVDSGPNKGQYQYTTQFGISNPAYKKKEEGSSSSSSSSSPASTSSAPAAPAGYGSHSHSTTEPLKTVSATAEPSWYSSPAAKPYPTAAHSNATTVAPTGGYYTSKNSSSSTRIAPTGSLPTTLRTTNGASNPAPTESIPVSTGAAAAAAGLTATGFFGLVLAAGAAAAVLAY